MLFAPSGPRSPRRSNRIKAILLTITIVLVLYFFFFTGPEATTTIAANEDKPSHVQRPKPSNDLRSKEKNEIAHPVVPQRKTMVVASMRSENTSWLAEHFPDWVQTIYVVDDRSAPLTVIRNKGRESMVYLTYIIDHYESLPDIMVFIHAQRFQWHNDDPYYDGVPMLRNFQIPYLQEQGYVNLRCVWTLGCPFEINPLTDTHRSSIHVGAYFKTAFMELFPGIPVPEKVGVSCCAQFGVTRARVLERPKSDYERFRKWLLETPLEDGLSGRVMEYSWHMIFGAGPIFCPTAKDCYCNVFGLCELNCPDDGRCEGRYVLPPYSTLPEGWPYVGWMGQAQDPSQGLAES